MKHSPLCSRDDGREIYFTAKDGAQKLRFTLSQNLLNEICGDDAAEPARKTWVTDNMSNILTLRTNPDSAEAPFDRILVEEIA